jgi:chemotaxis signal transduction protein
MTAVHAKIDWDEVRQRLARYQARLTKSEFADGDCLMEVFRRRARDLERSGRHETVPVSRVRVVVVRLGKERFGILLKDLKQVFPRVSITPIPRKRDLLLGVANLDGALRSVIDLGALLHTTGQRSDGEYVVVLRTRESAIALRVESLEGVSEIDLATLTTVDEVASGISGKLMRGITESRIIVLDTAAVVSHIKQELRGCKP